MDAVVVEQNLVAGHQRERCRVADNDAGKVGGSRVVVGKGDVVAGGNGEGTDAAEDYLEWQLVVL